MARYRIGNLGKFQDESVIRAGVVYVETSDAPGTPTRILISLVFQDGEFADGSRRLHDCLAYYDPDTKVLVPGSKNTNDRNRSLSWESRKPGNHDIPAQVLIPPDLDLTLLINRIERVLEDNFRNL